MSKLLTTGQMLDSIKVGEIAETQDEFQVLKRRNGSVTWHHDGDNPGNYVFINAVALDFKWRILPTYVSFEEAMKALKEGKKVVLEEHENGAIWVFNPVEYKANDGLEGFSLKEIFEGKWTIEVDE